MRKEKKFSVIGLIITIIILLAIAIFAINKIFGNDGIVSQYKAEDTEYNKHEVVEKLNLIIKEKYFGDYKYAQENNKDINEIYTEEAVWTYLIENNYINELKDINDNLVANEYYINTEYLNRDIVPYEVNKNGSEGNGTKVFKIKKIDTKYMIYFVDKYGEEEELGELIMHPQI